MKAIGYQKSLPIEDDRSLQDIEIDQPQSHGRDLLVKVHAIAVNPVDCKIRKRTSSSDESFKVLGWDCSGEIVSVGEQVEHFKVGDSVYYAGDLTRQGCNAEYQLVDERIVAHKPHSLSWPEAAAVPLTAITAWELLFEHLNLSMHGEAGLSQPAETILIVGAAGGVGSMLIQIAKTCTQAKVIATASREPSKQWVKELGADFVLDHSQDLRPQIESLELEITHIASLTHTQDYWEQYVDILAPFGKIGMIDDPDSLDVLKLKPKSQSLHIEFMFARSMFQTDDMNEQGKLLQKVGKLIEQGQIKTTMGQHLGQINAANLREAHALLESGSTIGKIVLEGF